MCQGWALPSMEGQHGAAVLLCGLSSVLCWAHFLWPASTTSSCLELLRAYLKEPPWDVDLLSWNFACSCRSFVGGGVSGEIFSEAAGRDRLWAGDGACCERGKQRSNEPRTFPSWLLWVLASSRRTKRSRSYSTEQTHTALKGFSFMLMWSRRSIYCLPEVFSCLERFSYKSSWVPVLLSS